VTSKTYLHARRLGGGAILSVGRDRYVVSDWSDGTGDVYGHRVLETGRGTYQRLPADLEPWVAIADRYAASEHRAPEGSPAERMILDEMEADEGPAFGENADPVLRAKRRLRGVDGLRDDMHDMARPFNERIAEIAAEAREAAAGMIRVRLRSLEAQFPRHRFSAGCWQFDPCSLRISPGVTFEGRRKGADDRIDRFVGTTGWLHRPHMPFQDVAVRIEAERRQIEAIILYFADGFSFDFGYVTTDEAHDAATGYGLSPLDETEEVPESQEA
jgi:hypothetical protein